MYSPLTATHLQLQKLHKEIVKLMLQCKSNLIPWENRGFGNTEGDANF